MALNKRVMAASAAVLGTGVAVVAPVEPASAHEVTISRGQAWATVGPAHSGIRICHFDGNWPYGYAEYKGLLPGHYGNVQADYGGCDDKTVSGGIGVFRLCLHDGVDHTCTGWKEVH